MTDMQTGAMPTDNVNNLPTIITQQRERRRWTKLKLADASGLSPSQVSKIEAGHGNVTLEVLEALAGAFGWKGWQLLKRSS